MLKYLYSQVYTNEIPRELTLGISILGCNIHCPECHSPHVWDINCIGQGKDLTTKELNKIIDANKWVSCILFFGGEWDIDYLSILLAYVKQSRIEDYKLALYSGQKLDFFQNNTVLLSQLNYLKVGEYNKALGGLIYPSTNQRLYKLKDGKIEEDITNLFWKTRIR